MYEYAPKFAKKKERGLSALALAVGLLIYFASYIPNIPYGVLLQIAGIGCMTVMVLLFSLVVARNYVYTVEQTDGGADFIVTECYGKRRTVVCRVALSSVQMAIPRTRESRAAFSAERRGKHFYNYTGVLFDEERVFLRIKEGSETVFLEICANKDLISVLTNH